jgi:hypothetical protein
VTLRDVFHEAFTWPRLEALSRRKQRVVTLADVPAEGWDALVLPDVDTVWLTGVWRRSERGTLEEPSFREATAAALPAATDDDVVGAAYCIRGYEVDERLGGDAGLAAAREALAARGVGRDAEGLYVALDPYGAHLFRIERP